MTPSNRLVPLVLAVTLFFAACAMLDTDPVYTVDTDYQMPAAPEARALALQCDEIKYSCLQLNETRMQSCMPPAEQDHEACMRDPMTAPFQCDDRLAAARQACDQSRDCEDRYDTCFERSGGTIQRTQRCVRNCQH